MVRPDAQLYYAYALTVKDGVNAMIADMESPPHVVIFDAITQERLDVTTADVLNSMVKRLHAAGIDTYLANVHQPVLNTGRKMGLLDRIGEGRVHGTVHLAVQTVEAAQSQSDLTLAPDEKSAGSDI